MSCPFRSIVPFVRGPLDSPDPAPSDRQLFLTPR